MRNGLGLFLVLLLAACGNGPDQAGLSTGLSALKAAVGLVIGPHHPPSAAQVAETRRTLEALGTPVVEVSTARPRYAALMVPYYPTKGAMVWSSESYETVTLRDGIVVATRGLGRDIMASQAPTSAEVSSASGSFHRIYEYLDGSDSAVEVDYDCDFAPGGSEEIDVYGRSYRTRLVIESCSKGEDRFQNRYWFDESGKIRQSLQLLAPGKAPMRLQGIVD